jgi:hypothetical protein
MKQITMLASAIVLAILSPVSADEPAALPPDLAAVPPGAAAFVHIRAADLWKSPVMSDLRTSILQAGPKALEAFDQRFIPAPSTIDRVTLVLLDAKNQPMDLPAVAIVACSKPFDRAAAIKNLLPGGKEVGSGANSYVADEEMGLAIRIIDDRTLAVAQSEAMKLFVDAQSSASGPLTKALHDAANKKTLVIAGRPDLIPGVARAEIPEPFASLAQARIAEFSLDIDSRIRANLRLTYADEAAAQAAQNAGRQLIKMAGQSLERLRSELQTKLASPERKGTWPISELPETMLAVAGLGALNQADEWLHELPVNREGNAIATSVDFRVEPFALITRSYGLALASMLRAVPMNGGFGGSRTANNLKQMMLAFHNYHDSFDGFPAAAICDEKGKPLLSWRVAILPYIEQDNLYRQFHLDEPWDSEHNKKLIPLMPKTYALPGADSTKAGMTHFRVFYGNGAALDLNKKVRITDFLDGTSNTLVIVEATDPAIWTKPDDFEYQPEKPLPKLGRPTADGFWVAMGDGSVRFVKKTISEKTLRAVITRAGGEVIGPDFQ